MTISFRKVDAVPSDPLPDCMYLVDDGTGMLQVHMASRDGAYTLGTMSGAIVEQMISNGSAVVVDDYDPGDLAALFQSS